ncbi:MAG: M20/M25/M40 family metallo-hydrolase [Deltaproteobacteria bacterium]|nr:M20/M25/M40 family metallo-hydrolase [Deltaproteobacteria bacterium]
MTTSDDVALWLSDKLPAMEAALAPLVEINSFTDNVDGGRAVGAALRSLFALPGVEAKTIPSARYADHVVLSTRGDAKQAPIALVGHLDTVFPPGTFEGYRRDGDLRRGPGALDMKGGLVVVAFALRAIAETVGLDAIAPLRIVIVADEEVGSPEGQGVIRDAIAGAHACLVFESGRAGDAIITRRKGTGMVKAIAHGKGAHAGNLHHEGKNAIWALARFVDGVQRLTDYDRGVTVNVGKVSGGTSKNTVPDRAEALVDLRFCTHADAERLVEDVRRVAAEVGVEIAGTSVEIEGGIAREPLERTDASVALMNAYAEAARAAGLGASEAPLIGGGSDASTSGAMGIASIDGLGPRGKGFHTTDEQIEAITLVQKADALARFLTR